MQTFLEQLAHTIIQKHAKLDEVTLVFPNRRAALYFRKYLTLQLKSPVFAPTLTTIEEFISAKSVLRIPERLELIHELFQAYQTVIPSDETFDKFYFWGDMLVRDFDEVDKYLVRADYLFKDLRNQKELESGFDFLTDEQKQFLISFWSNFEQHLTKNKDKFIVVWQQLHQVYLTYKDRLRSKGLAYEGMVHRDVAEQIESLFPSANTSFANWYFVGFNALTGAEEKIINHAVTLGATLKWDIDSYYVHDTRQEAGRFFREYQQHTVLGKTFDVDLPANFSAQKDVKIFGASQPVGQAKLMTQHLGELLASGMNPEETLVVLPDEKLMLPVLHGVSAHVDKLNVTMGFPLSSTPLFNLVELLIELQIHKRGENFNHREVLALLGHPYIVGVNAAAANRLRKDIRDKNRLHIAADMLVSEDALYAVIFKPVEVHEVIHYLRDVLTKLTVAEGIATFDQEYVNYFLVFLNQIENVLGTTFTDFKSFFKLFKQLIRAQKIPFSGEPLRGLQIMGVLETRNLDFKNVFVLSLNEGALPSGGSKGSYIPYNIRKAYSMPTFEHQDSMYAYLFYRVLQRAEHIHLYYNTETDVLGQGEMSRYLQQLIFERGWNLTGILHNAIRPRTAEPIVVQKDERVTNKLGNFLKGRGKQFYPSYLNDYIECSLRFYFKKIADLREVNEVEEDMDARVFGNIFHLTVEYFYHDLIERKKSFLVEPDDFQNLDKQLDALIERAFRKNYSLSDKPISYEGQQVVVKEIVKRFARRVLDQDKAYAPFTIEGLEKKDMMCYITLDVPGNPQVAVSGIVDRADRKDNTLRIIDYKTGKDKTEMEGDVASLFHPEKKHNKAAFQTFLYALVAKYNLTSFNTIKASDHMRIVPGLLSRANLFQDDFSFGLRMNKQLLDDVTPYLPEFEAELKKLLEEIYDTSIPFKQTENLEACKYCDYKSICYRN